MGLRPTEEVESAGLDVSEHGEEGYHDTPFGTSGAHEAYTSAAVAHPATLMKTSDAPAM